MQKKNANSIILVYIDFCKKKARKLTPQKWFYFIWRKTVISEMTFKFVIT